MRVERRTNLLAGVVILALALAFLARAFGLIPANLADLLIRALPALLILFGLSLLLRGRIPASGLLALMLTGALVAGVTMAAYTQRAAQSRTDTQQPLAVDLSGVTLLRLRIETLASDVELVTSLGTGAASGLFTGSAENTVSQSLTRAEDGSADLTLTETQTSQFPRLDAVGRGALRLELPVSLPIDLDLAASDGSVILNLGGLALERSNVTVSRGDLIVTLPDYAPALAGNTSNGALTAADGDLTVFIPASVAARLELNRASSGIDPLYDADRYNYLVGDILEARTIETAAAVVRYTLIAPRGRIRVEVPPG